MACGALSYRQKGIMEDLRDLRSLKKAGQNTSASGLLLSTNALFPLGDGWV